MKTGLSDSRLSAVISNQGRKVEDETFGAERQGWQEALGPEGGTPV
jgi:hypothetical protein